MDAAPGGVEPQDSDPPTTTEQSNDEELALQCEEEETKAGGAQGMEEELNDANQDSDTPSADAAEQSDADQDPVTAFADAAELNDADQDLVTASAVAGGAAEEAEAEVDVELVPLGADVATPVAGGKRKRGRPRKSQSAKQQPKQQPKKRDEEDVCFVCYDGGSLVCCDRRGCPKVYHAACIHQDEDFFKSRGKWNCGWHICSNCEKAAQYMCYTCTYSLCRRCVNEYGFVCIRRNKGFCETCYSTVMRIESNEDDGEEKVGTVSGQTNNIDCLFKTYWFYMKEKFSLTLEELQKGEKKLKESGAHARKGDSSSDELYTGNDEEEASSDSSSGRRGSRTSSRKKAGRQSRATVIEDTGLLQILQNEEALIPEENQWASKELLEFVAHMKGGDRSVLSQFDVQALLLEYIKLNNLRDPRKKSQIICDPRLKSLFGKARVGHFEMLKLLESHFYIKEVQKAVTDDNQGAVVDPDSGQMDTEAYFDGATKGISDKRRKGRKKIEERELQTNLDDYAAIDVHNISLIYLRRNLMEDLLDDSDKFSENVIGSFVRIRISGAAKQDMYRLVQVVGISKAAESYKTGKKTTDFTVEILNLDKKELITIDTLSNQDFTEDECRRLRQSIRCGLISRLTVGDIQEKSRLLQAVRVNDSLENEKQRLIHLRDRASETGRRKELRECVEKLQLLSTPEERIRRLNEVPEIHVDPKMDPDYESADEEESADKNQDASESPSFRKGRDLVSPGRGARRSSSFPPSLTRNSRTGAAWDKIDSLNGPINRNNEPLWCKEQDDLRTTTRGAGKRTSNDGSSEAAAWNDILPKADLGLSQAVSPEATPAPHTSDRSETEKLWNYRDPAGSIQGPFSMVQLRKWSTTGYFPDDLRIWRASETEEDSVLLYDALIGKFEKDLPQWEPPRSNFSQPGTVEAGTESRPNEQEDSWRHNSNNLLATNSNTLSGVWTGTVNVERVDVSGWTQPSIASAPRMEAVNSVEVKSAIPTDASTWSGLQLQNNPRPPIYSAPYGTPSYQGGGVQGMVNAAVQNPGQDHRGNWSMNNSRPMQPQFFGGQHSNWGPSAQQHPANQWGNVPYNNSMSAPTQLPGSQVWPAAQGTIQPAGTGWGKMNIPASPAPNVRPVGTGWGMINVRPLPAPVQPTIGGGWAAPPVAGFNGGLQPGVAAVDQNRAAIMGNNNPAILQRNGASNLVVPDRPHNERVFSQSGNSFFESDCPSPTPSNERQGLLIAIQSDPQGNMSPIRDSQPKLSAEGAQDMSGDLWSLPSPTPSTKPSASQPGWGTNNNNDTGTAKENLHRGWGATTQGSESAAAWGTPPQAITNPNPNPNLSQGWGVVHENSNTNVNASWGTGAVQLNSGWAGGPGDTNGSWGTEQTPNGDPYRGEHGRDSRRGASSRFDGDPRHDSRFGGDSRRDERYRGDSRYESRRGGEQDHRDHRGGRSPRTPPRGQGGQGQGICKFHESGHCKKGSRCNYLHL